MKPPPRTPSFLLENARWMLTAFGLAFGLWLVATLQTDPVEERIFTQAIRIEYQIDANTIITNSPQAEALVTVRAPRSVLGSLRADQIDIVADARGREMGSQRIDLEAELLSGLRGEIVDILPRRVEVVLEQQVSKRLAITPQVIQEPPSGFTYPPPTCALAEVTAQGAASLLDRALVSARLNLTDYRNPVTLITTLTVTNEFGRALSGVTLETNQVECRVEIAPIAGVSELSVVPIVTGFPPSGYIYEGFDFAPRTVIVTGSPRGIRDMNGVVNTETIDLKNATSTFERIVPLILPAGVELLPVTQTITVTVKIGTVMGSSQFADLPIQIEGLIPSLSADVLPDTVTVFVVGPQPILEMLSADDLRVAVNVGNNDVGTYQKEVLVSVANQDILGQLTLTVQPPEVNITIFPLR